MQDDSVPQRPAGPRKKHEHWVALKAAYERYAAASDLVQAVTADGPRTGPESEFIRAVEDQQRAFQQYIEARLQFLECHVDETHAPVTPPTDSLPPVVRKARPTVAVAALVCGFIFSSTYGDKTRTQKLEMAAVRPQPSVNPGLTSRPPLGGAPEPQMAARVSAKSGVTEAITPTSSAPARHVAAENTRSNRAQRPRSSNPILAHAPNLRAGTQRALLRPSVSYDFVLSPTRQTIQIGSLRVRLTAMDPKRRSVRLSVVSQSVRPDSKHPASNQVAHRGHDSREARVGSIADAFGMPLFQ